MRIYPVIHVHDLDQVSEQVEVARRHPISGVFLIDHDADDIRLARCIDHVRLKQPDIFLGANVIRRSATEALNILAPHFPGGIPLDAIWTDNAGVSLDGDDHEFRSLHSARERTGWTGLHFGGIAFKYQTPVSESDLPRLGELARRHVDIPTTSGPGTGLAADTHKLEALRQGLHNHPLALASGVTPDNVESFIGLVDHILVSTGIADDNDRIDSGKLAALLERCTVEQRN
ncbi:MULTISPECIES: adenine phosphoribosyltransferase [Rhodococcus]|uniref:adenine phosphoribosyltransferase n=1 Tax=Rhodococcus TaxID=1827 RepID=UPI000BA1DC77|nr:adenine phosphoribosyltransferase [Rhodococcus pyridinivorans]